MQRGQTPDTAELAGVVVGVDDAAVAIVVRLTLFSARAGQTRCSRGRFRSRLDPA